MASTDDFSSYYLQRATKELAKDLEEVREARDFKLESIRVLVHAIQQGSSSFPADQRAMVTAATAQPTGDKPATTSREIVAKNDAIVDQCHIGLVPTIKHLSLWNPRQSLPRSLLGLYLLRIEPVKKRAIRGVDMGRQTSPNSKIVC
ncbi:uncharacterized protein DNG_07774 [Cephalotrichum gorgonifer]|uniref:Ribosome-assembly protein 3 C-terminal domain-containing protein n=1 Tax=Cephalotrichum gorgonifer TaxID=2041049 RepID=A0AAE8N3Y0_9PEZI|nr:uncharacterized protein DNG_07774 [Cephalotrichum gorgonifer]